MHVAIVRPMLLVLLTVPFAAVTFVTSSAQPADDAPAQDPPAAEADAPPSADPEPVIGAQLESCFNSRSMIDISILDDGHMYVRTRGNNHYLITTEICENLERSYLHRTARLVPYGREVCLNDGSHIVYENVGREEVCPIRGIERVDDRQQARDLAAGREPVVEFEELPAEVQTPPPE